MSRAELVEKAKALGIKNIAKKNMVVLADEIQTLTSSKKSAPTIATAKCNRLRKAGCLADSGCQWTVGKGCYNQVGKKPCTDSRCLDNRAIADALSKHLDPKSLSKMATVSKSLRDAKAVAIKTRADDFAKAKHRVAKLANSLSKHNPVNIVRIKILDRFRNPFVADEVIELDTSKNSVYHIKMGSPKTEMTLSYMVDFVDSLVEQLLTSNDIMLHFEVPLHPSFNGGTSVRIAQSYIERHIDLRISLLESGVDPVLYMSANNKSYKEMLGYLKKLDGSFKMENMSLQTYQLRIMLPLVEFVESFLKHSEKVEAINRQWWDTDPIGKALVDI